MSTLQTNEVVDDLDVELMSALDDIDFSDIDDEPEEDEVVVSAALKDLSLEEEISEVYDEQEESLEARKIPEVLEVIEDEPAVEVKAAPVKEKRAKSPSLRSAKIAAKLGGDLDDMITITPEWAELSAEDRLKNFSALIDGMAEYVGDKAVNLFTFLKTGGGLNIVTSRTFDLFLNDGYIVGGKEGNLVRNLLAKPYSIGTANSQANQMLRMFTLLEIGKRASDGKIVPNEDSVILDRVKAILGK